MVEDIIKYNEKEYQLLTVYKMGLFKTTISPIENKVVSDSEVYCFRTTDVNRSKYKHMDIYADVEKYLSDKAIEKYLACKSCSKQCSIMCKYFEQKSIQKMEF